MDAFEFHKELRRMCAKYRSCQGCPMAVIKSHDHCENFLVHSEKKVREMIAIVEKWSKEHPKKTMAQDFFEKHPNAPKYNGCEIPVTCPYQCGYTDESVCLGGIDCVSCWNRPLED